MQKYVIPNQTSLYQALQQMNDQRVKFLVAVDTTGKVQGTLTDGDIRRGILDQMGLDEPVEAAICKDFTWVSCEDGLSHILEAFRDARIGFLPVLDKDGRLKNIITRRGLQVLLLTNKEFSISFDFSSLDEGMLEHEIFARPWGFYKTTVLNSIFQSKVIYVSPGQMLSLQSHRRREEYWIVVHGEGMIQIGESVHPVAPGGTYFIPKGCIHRLENTSPSETLIITEVQLGDYFGEDDICRFSDEYGRA